MKQTLSLAALLLTAVAPTSVSAQTRTARQTATAYGARLNAKAEPQALNQARWNNRINSRLDTRIGLRIERFRVGSAADPVAAYKAPTDDRSRAATIVTPPAPPTDLDQPQ